MNQAYKRADHRHNTGRHHGPAKPRMERLRPLLWRLSEKDRGTRRYDK